jgi:PAS domain S-box-containing protein
VTARVSATAEFDAIARLVAALFDAPIATVSAFDDDATVRVGARGVPWSPDDEELLVRELAARDAGEPVALDLSEISHASALVSDGARHVCGYPVRDHATALGAIAVYAPHAMTPSLAIRRRMLDLAQVAAGLLRGRREARAIAAGAHAVRLAGALGDLVRAADWRASLKIAIEALGAARAVHWAVRGVMLEPAGVWDRGGRFAPPGVAAASAPGVVRALGEAGVIVSRDAGSDARLAELAAYSRTAQVGGQLMAAILHRDRIIAAIAFEHGEPRSWSPAEQQFCAAIAGWLGPLLALAEGGKNLDFAEHHVLEFVERARERIMIADRDGRLIYGNASAAALWGAPGSVAGRSLGELNPPELRNLPGLDRFRRTGDDPNLAQPFVRRVTPPAEPARLMEVSITSYTLNAAPYLGLIVRELGPIGHRLEATMEGVAVAVGHVSLDGQFLRFNARLPELLGRTATELRPFAQGDDLRPPADRPGLSMVDVFGLAGRLDLGVLHARLLAVPQLHQLAYELTRPDGSRRWIELSISLVRELEGQPAYFVISAVDRTPYHRASAVLRDLASVLSLTGSELYERVCAYLGETLGARHVHIARLREQMLEPVAAWPGDRAARPYPVAGTPCESVLRSGLCHYPERIQALFPHDGALVEFAAHSYLGAPLPDSTGAALGVIAVIGERRLVAPVPVEDLVQLCATRVAVALQHGEAMAVLEGREQQLRQITETASETFWLLEWPSRALIYVTPAFEALTGRTIASLHADRATWGAGLHPDDRARIGAAMAGLVSAAVDETARVIRSDGQLRWIQIRAALIRDRDGRPYRVAGTFEDITRVKDAQFALEQRERELAEALASSEREVAELQARLGDEPQHGMIGGSQAIRAVLRRLRQAAQHDVTVLVSGESGTGKELAAKALHAMSARKTGPFVAINCAAIPEPLLESELFGYVKGAFTGASRDKAGLIQAADGGTLFLDEIGDMSPVLQVKLLRVLQERQIHQVGDDRPIAVDVRLVSASHRDLKALVAAGRMREDFYYRIKVFEVAMPALRDRREDIPALASHFAVELGRAAGKPHIAIAPDAQRALLAHPWPGNVRELRNAIEHALVTVNGSTIQLHDLPVELRGADARSAAGPEPAVGPHPTGARAGSPGAQRDEIEEALRRSGGNRAEAARLLGIGRVTLWKRMRRLGMTTDEVAGADVGDGGSRDR